MDGLAVYVKEGLPFPWDLSLENSQDSYLLALLHSVSLHLFPLLITFFLCTIFDAILSNIDESLSINPPAKDSS